MALGAYSMQDPANELPRICLPRTLVNRARRRRGGVLIENKDSGPPFRQGEKAYYYSK
jgi:hypothetical protein